MHDIHIVFDAVDPDRVARFWMTALAGYDYPGSAPDGVPGSPPAGYPTWEAWADDNDIPVELRYSARTLVDTKGNRPDIQFIQVPETKQIKNRVHLDIRLDRQLPPDERRELQDAEAARLTAAGGTLVGRVTAGGGSWLVMRDVEGNEFCVT